MTKQPVLGLRFVQPSHAKRAFRPAHHSFLGHSVGRGQGTRDCCASRNVVYIFGRFLVKSSTKSFSIDGETTFITFKRQAMGTHGWRTMSS